jgi:hypothetical protein
MLKRGLNVALAIVALTATGCTWRPGRTEGPSYIQKFPSDLADSRLELDGIYADGWTAPKASLSLFEPRGQQVLAIRGLIPKIDRDDFRTDVEVSLDDKVVAKKSVGLGNFSIEVRVPPSPLDLADVYRDLLRRGQLASYQAVERFYEIGSPGGIAEFNAFLAAQGRALSL